MFPASQRPRRPLPLSGAAGEQLQLLTASRSGTCGPRPHLSREREDVRRWEASMQVDVSRVCCVLCVCVHRRTRWMPWSAFPLSDSLASENTLAVCVALVAVLLGVGAYQRVSANRPLCGPCSRKRQRRRRRREDRRATRRRTGPAEERSVDGGGRGGERERRACRVGGGGKKKVDKEAAERTLDLLNKLEERQTDTDTQSQTKPRGNPPAAGAGDGLQVCRLCSS